MFSRRFVVVSTLMLAGFAVFVAGIAVVAGKESIDSKQFTIVVVGGSIMFGTAVLWFISECLKVRAAVLAEPVPVPAPVPAPVAQDATVIQPRLSKSVSFEKLETKTPIIRVIRGKGIQV
jgi:hypothetical protein